MGIRRSFSWALLLAISTLFTATTTKAQDAHEIDTRLATRDRIRPGQNHHLSAAT